MGDTNTCIVLLVGVPAAGKTTFCNQLTLDYTTHVINYDELMPNYSSASRKIVFGKVELLVRDCVADKNNARHVILIDDNLYYRSMRGEYISLCKKAGIGCFQMFFQLDLQTAILRNRNREINVPETIIVDMYHKLEVPTGNVLYVYSNRNCLGEFMGFLDYAFKNPLKEIVIKTLPASKMHIVDLTLRKIVGYYVKLHGNSDSYNITRKVVYNNIKGGNISIDNIHDSDLYNFLITYFKFFDFNKQDK